MKCKSGIACALLFVISQVWAAAKEPAPQTMPVDPMTPRSVGMHFDPTRTSLPTHFQGNDFESLYNYLVLTVEPKGEFETTKEYQTRKEKVSRHVYAFLFPRSWQSGINGEYTVSYDADAHRFTVQLKTHYLPDSKQSLFILRETVNEDGSYVGSNALGASEVIKKERIARWGVIPYNFILPYPGPIRFLVPAEPKRARDINQRLALLAVCEVGPESVPDRKPSTGDVLDSIFLGPRTNLPYETSIYYRAIKSKVLSFWVFDVTTGEIFGKFNEKGEPLKTKAQKANPKTFNQETETCPPFTGRCD